MEATSLEEVAAVAEQVADDQRQIARQARAMQRQHYLGKTWGESLESQPSPHLLDRLRRSHRLLGSTATRLSATIAQHLRSEGESRRQIAARLGVSHQRVSTLLGGRDGEGLEVTGS